jgi:hypothetical protein
MNKKIIKTKDGKVIISGMKNKLDYSLQEYNNESWKWWYWILFIGIPIVVGILDITLHW